MRRRRRGLADRATEREVEVVSALLVAGSTKAAAHRLGLAERTVRSHLANARSKLGAESTPQLVWILRSRIRAPGGLVQNDR
jgi:DNA-binding NarL/FixJ family response regulator